MRTGVITHTTCTHCGEPCIDGDLSLGESSFCCEGCLTVYQLLSDNDLCTYYDLDQNPGKTINSGIERKRFEYLRDLDVQDKLIDFKSEHIPLRSQSFFNQK